MSDVFAVQENIGFINLRGEVGDVAFFEAAEKALGQVLPREPNHFSEDAHRVYWLGPDEWLVRTSAGEAPGLCRRLDEVLYGIHAAVNDVSGGNMAAKLSGETARAALEKGCTLDLYPGAFEPGSCAQTGLGKATVLLGMLDASPTYEIVVRRSFGDYLWHWLGHVI